MLDLDRLARARAASVKEDEEAWAKAVWSPEFQKISSNMSDSEVERLFELCLSVAEFERVTKHLKEKFELTGVSPFTVLEEEAKRAGQSADNWIKNLA